MLSISNMSSGQEGYYLELAREDYYLEGGEPPGRWLGQGAFELGLEGTVEREQLRNLFRGRFPDGSPDLVQAQGKNRQPGWDLTFSAPKSFSVLVVMSEPDIQRQLLAAEMCAVRTATEYLQTHASWTRRGAKGKEVEATNPIIAAFPHSTSRAGEPSNHVHCLWLNAGVREDGGTGTIRSRDLYRHMMAAGEVFKTSLEHELNQLGVHTAVDEQSFQIVGVPDQVCEHFSSRRAEIVAKTKALGFYSAKAAEVAALSTRKVKGHISRAELDPVWQLDSTKLGFSKKDAAGLIGRILPPPSQAAQRKLVDNAVKTAVESLALFRGHFTDYNITALAGRELRASGVSPTAFLEGVEEGLSNLHELDGSPAMRRFTTHEHYALEHNLISHANALALQPSHVVPDKAVAAAIKRHPDLRPEQEDVVRYITTSPTSLALIDGVSGIEATYALAAAREAWESQGLRVMGVGASQSAANGIFEKARIKSYSAFGLRFLLEGPTLLQTLKFEAQHLARNLRTWESRPGLPQLGIRPRKVVWHELKQLIRVAQGNRRQQRPKNSLTERDVLVFDATSMLNIREAEPLLRKAKEAGCQVCMFGSRQGMPSILAGGLFLSLNDRFGGHEVADGLQRREEWERTAIDQLAEGDVRGALSKYVRAGKLEVYETRKEAQLQIADDIVTAMSGEGRAKPDPLRVVAVADSNAEVDKLNQAVKRAHRLQTPWLLSRTVKLKGESICVGDVVAFKKGASLDGGAVFAGERGVVKKFERLSIDRGHIEVTVELQRKELQRLPIKWLTCGRLRNVTVRFCVRDGVDVGLGYALSTRDSANGQFDQSFVLAGGPHSSAESTFSQLTRSGQPAKLYMGATEAGEDLRALEKAVTRERSSTLAHDLAHANERNRRFEPYASAYVELESTAWVREQKAQGTAGMTPSQSPVQDSAEEKQPQEPALEKGEQQAHQAWFQDEHRRIQELAEQRRLEQERAQRQQEEERTR